MASSQCHVIMQLAFSLDVGDSKVAQNVVACLEMTDLGFGVFWLIDQQINRIALDCFHRSVLAQPRQVMGATAPF